MHAIFRREINNNKWTSYLLSFLPKSKFINFRTNIKDLNELRTFRLLVVLVTKVLYFGDWYWGLYAKSHYISQKPLQGFCLKPLQSSYRHVHIPRIRPLCYRTIGNRSVRLAKNQIIHSKDLSLIPPN